MKQKRLDFLSLRWDSYDRVAFFKDALSYSKNSIIMFRDFNYLRLSHKPDHIKRFPLTIKLRLSVKNHFLQQAFLLYSILLTQILLPAYLCARYRPKICVTDAPLIAAVYGIAKKIKLCKRIIYHGSDWFLVNKKRTPLKYIALFFAFYYPDYLAVSWSDLVIDVSPEVKKLRTQYWRKDVIKRGIITFPVPMQINGSTNDSHRKHICFLGKIREASGLNILLSTLPKLNEKYGVKFKLFGPENHTRDAFQKKVKEQGLESLIDFHGWINMETEQALIRDCFCGVNLLNSSEDNHSIFVTPGKVMHYMQNLIPPLITENSALPLFINLLKKNNWGITTELNPEKIKSAIEHLFQNQQFFRENLKKYAADYPYMSIVETIGKIEGLESKND